NQREVVGEHRNVVGDGTRTRAIGPRRVATVAVLLLDQVVDAATDRELAVEVTERDEGVSTTDRIALVSDQVSPAAVLVLRQAQVGHRAALRLDSMHDRSFMRAGLDGQQRTKDR